MPTASAINLETVYEGESHLDWAAGIAKAISRASGFKANYPEEEELIQVAHLLLLRRAIGDEKMPQFDDSKVPEGGTADGLFRGSVHTNIKYECIREARRLRGGGVPGAATRSNKVCELPNWTNELGEEEDEAAITDECRARDTDAKEALASLLEHAELDCTEERVIRSLYGIGEPERSREQVAMQWGARVEDVQEYEQSALAKLRRFAALGGMIEPARQSDTHLSSSGPEKLAC